MANVDHTNSRAVEENLGNQELFKDTAKAEQLKDSFSYALSQENENSAIDSVTYNLQRITAEFGSADFFDILLNLYLESNEERFRKLEKKVEEAGDDIQSIIKLINYEIGATLIEINGDNVSISINGLLEIVQDFSNFVMQIFQDNVFLQLTVTKIIQEQVNNSIPIVKSFLEDKKIPLKDLQIALAATSISRSKRNVDIFGTLIEFLRTILRTVFSPIQSFMNTVFNTLNNYVLSLYVENESENGILKFITSITNNIVTGVSQFVTGVQDFANTVFDNILYGNTNSTTTTPLTTTEAVATTTGAAATPTTGAAAAATTTGAAATSSETIARKRRDVSFYEIDDDFMGKDRSLQRLKREIDIFGTINDLLRSALVPIFSEVQTTINNFLDGVSNFVLSLYVTTEPDNVILKSISNITNNIVITVAEWIASVQDFSNSVFDNFLYGNGTSTATASATTPSAATDTNVISEATARKRRSVHFYSVDDTFGPGSKRLIRSKREIDIIGTVLDFFRSLISPFVSQIQTTINSIFDGVSNFILSLYVATEPDNSFLKTITSFTNRVVIAIAEFLANGEDFVNAVFDNVIWGNGTWSQTNSTTDSIAVTTEIAAANDTVRKVDDNNIEDSDDALTKSSRADENIFTNITAWINNFLKTIINNVLSNAYEPIGKLITYPLRYIAETVIDFVFSCSNNCTSIL